MRSIVIALIMSTLICSLCCNNGNSELIKQRVPVDSVGFPIYPSQIEAFIKAVDLKFENDLKTISQRNLITNQTNWKVLIAPHDDYAYVQYLYPASLKNLKAKTIFIIGVAHKAKKFKLENKLIFDSFTHWNAPYGSIKGSEIRKELIQSLNQRDLIVHDSMHSEEHSIEPFLPIIQYFNKDFEIVPILVPYMSFEKMKKISRELAIKINEIAVSKNWEWGKDFAILISNDAVHYGNEEWGDNNFAFFGTGDEGYQLAKEHDMEIIDHCFLGGLDSLKIEKFFNYTVSDKDYKEYKYTWCGRYSVPFGLLVANFLQEFRKIKLKDRFIGYSTSIAYPPLDTSGLGIGFTAPATINHWVGYASVGYE